MLQIEPGTNRNHAPIVQAQSDGYSANSQEILVQWKMCFQRGMNTNMLHLQVDNLWE